MPKVISTNYSNLYDLHTKVQFNSVLDQRSGCYIGLADVSQEEAEYFATREGFEVLSEAEFAALSQARPVAAELGAPASVPESDASGDELEKLSYNEIVAKAKTLGLDLRGKKPELIERIRAFGKSKDPSDEDELSDEDGPSKEPEA